MKHVVHQHLFPRLFLALIAALIVVALSLFVAACGGSVSPGTTAGVGPTVTTASGSATTTGDGGSPIQVIMTNRSYDPNTVTVEVGDTVTWVNQDSPQHDVVADNGEFKSELFDTGGTFSFTFTQPGTYPYHCSIHPGMVGTVTVQ